MNAGGWTTELLGLHNEKTIQLKLARLIERGFADTRTNPTRRWDRTPQWLFKRLAVQDAVNLWEIQRPQPDLDPTAGDTDQSTEAIRGFGTFRFFSAGLA
ncbi:hypothetical protein FNU79_18175 [Deinococcus detaillensis]|uniref:Uncharacterized protein n=1 Tax=Deinococcus detaillensis TaxID=2592048 RepID=A0A553UGH7_9DEIO|nr:hypothetical protein [Deinococcus detaillensis]TSA79285.1 hypothetical protein FNU79_18175 [Deinococcus detaillensis]